MPRRSPTNAELADRLELFAALLELRDASPYASRAYRRAAEIVRSLPAPVGDLVRSGRIRNVRGIGAGIEGRLRELVETGDIAELAVLEQELDPQLVALGRLVGLAPERVLAAARELDVHDVAGFRAAVLDGRLRTVPGFGPATEAKVLAGLERPPRAPRGLTLDRSLALSRAIADGVGGEVAGAARRGAELAHEVVVVCAGESAEPAVERLRALPAVVAVLETSSTGVVGLTLEGVPVRLVVAEPARFGTELVRATGAEEWVAALEPLPDAVDEGGVFARLGLPYRPPELREVSATVPEAGLVTAADVRGDLHCHTTWSDGKASVLEMAEAARERGYEYLAICDHSPNVGVVHGLDADELRRQGEEIAAVNEQLAPFRVLRGVECDIRADGSLDVDDAVLAELDWVQLSLHAGQRRPASELTRIVTEAMRNPYVRALSHPTGRLLNRRPENAVELDEVFEVAVGQGVALEVNGLPDRLDLSAANVREALAAGVELVLNSDAHSTRGLENVALAVATARRGGVTRASIVNCRSVADVLRGAR